MVIPSPGLLQGRARRLSASVHAQWSEEADDVDNSCWLRSVHEELALAAPASCISEFYLESWVAAFRPRLGGVCGSFGAIMNRSTYFPMWIRRRTRTGTVRSSSRSALYDSAPNVRGSAIVSRVLA